MATVRLAGWKSEEGQRAYLAACDSAMRLWPVPFESRQVGTRTRPESPRAAGCMPSTLSARRARGRKPARCSTGPTAETGWRM